MFSRSTSGFMGRGWGGFQNKCGVYAEQLYVSVTYDEALNRLIGHLKQQRRRRFMITTHGEQLQFKLLSVPQA